MSWARDTGSFCLVSPGSWVPPVMFTDLACVHFEGADHVGGRVPLSGVTHIFSIKIFSYHII